MEKTVEVLFWCISGLFGIQFILSLYFSARMTNRLKKPDKFISSISIVIPFHNEELRMNELLNSLSKIPAEKKNIEVIFVNDHSNDGTQQLIKNRLAVPYSIISLEKKEGKKAAIHQGISVAKHEHILTLDADVKLPDLYLEAIFQLPDTDLIILPVNMSGQSFFQRIFSIEFQWLQVLTFGLSKPILCNGANLLFRKSAYYSTFSRRSDFDLPSGDDVFLLRAFINADMRIMRFYDDTLMVETQAPSSISELLKQRKRWISKFRRMATFSNAMPLVFLVSLQLAFLVAVAVVFFNPLFLIPLTVKLITEFLIAAHFGYRYAEIFWLVLFHQFWYPMYIFLLLFPTKKESRWEFKTDSFQA